MSVVPTSVAQAAAWQARTAPVTEEIRPGLWAIATPVPTPITFTFCYVLEADGRLLVIDTGWPDEAARTALTEGLAAIGHRLADVSTIVVTHLHPDHAGLAGWLLDQAPTATLWMHPDDLDRIVPAGQERRREVDDGWARFMTTVGAPDEIGIGTRVNVMPPLRADQAARTATLDDGTKVQHGSWELDVVWTPGHTRGSLVLHEPVHGLLFSGDHVLPTVTPAVTQQNHADDDILGNFLDSLTRVRELPIDEVLPGHQYRFRGLSSRIDEMHEHHAARLAELMAAIAERPGANCYDLARRLHWNNGGFDALSHRDRAMAARETLAHLTHLRLGSRITTRVDSEHADPVAGWYHG